MRSAADSAPPASPRPGDPVPGRPDAGVDMAYRRARLMTVASVGSMIVASVAMPMIGLPVEDRIAWRLLGAVGIAAFTASLAWALIGEFRNGATDRHRRRSLAVFIGASVTSVPLVGPLGAASGEWESWAWLGAALVGAVPLLVRTARMATVVVALAVVTSAGVARLNDGAVLDYVAITAGVGTTLALVNGLQLGMWRLFAQARDGQDARARLAVIEERLRFARDVHDLLGHDLSVIALKAELTARLAPIDAGRAGAQAAEIQHLAASALGEVRRAVHGYRAVDIREHLDAIEQVLATAGVACVVRRPGGDLPAEASHLVPVLREAVTNLLRHSRAAHCTIDVDAPPGQVRMVVLNDGVADRLPDQAPDPYSHGLRGLADRLAEVGGTLVAESRDGSFTLTAAVPVPA